MIILANVSVQVWHLWIKMLLMDAYACVCILCYRTYAHPNLHVHSYKRLKVLRVPLLSNIQKSFSLYLTLCAAAFLNKEALSVAHHRHTHMHTQWQQCVILKGIIWEAGERKVEGGKKKQPKTQHHFCISVVSRLKRKGLEIWMEAENRDEGLEDWKKQTEGWCEFPRER